MLENGLYDTMKKLHIESVKSWKNGQEEGVSYSMAHPLSFIYTCLVGKTIGSPDKLGGLSI